MTDEAGLTPGFEHGPTDHRVARQHLRELGRPIIYTLMAPGWRPPDDRVTQAYGICYTEAGLVVLVEKSGGYWNLPGGQVERGEHMVETLRREVVEEACARVVAHRYLACQHVWDPEAPDGRISHYQTRWWARVELDPWLPQHEMVSRLLVESGDVVDKLSWEDSTIASALVAQAVGAELTFRGSCHGAGLEHDGTDRGGGWESG